MWIAKKTHQKLVEQAERERTVSEANKVLQVNLDWFRFRVTQLEKERAQLVNAVLGVKIPTPMFETIADGADARELDQPVTFEDMGDREASKLGIRHAEDGSLIYATPAKVMEN